MIEDFDANIEFETDTVEPLPDTKIVVDPIVAYIKDRFQRAEDGKRADEMRMLTCFNNFRGVYGPDTQFSESEKSRVFVKVTKTKVLAAYGQLIQVMFGNGDFPITVDQTKLPDGVVESVSFDPQGAPPPPTASTKGPTNPFGTRDKPLPPGATIYDLQSLGPLADKLEPIQDQLVAGEGMTPTAVTFHPAQVAAKRMEKKIKDQLDESNASKHLRSSIFEMSLFGTGVLKGPFAVDKEYSRWDETGMYNPLIKVLPSISHVSVWNFYPDPDAKNMDEAEWVIERHKMSRHQLRALKNRPHFRTKAINMAIKAGKNYELKDWENSMGDMALGEGVERWEVLEYWGFIDTELLREKGVSIPRSLAKFDEVNVNIWICNNEVLRLVMNPFKPTRIPYFAAPYELNPYSFFGIGVAENMEDTQLLMNGFMRLAVDNAALSGNLIIEVDENAITADQDLEFYPGKVIRRQSGAPGQALFATEFPNVSAQNMMLFDKARVLSDESTGIPSFSHGQTGVTGIGRTASGISMLMDAAHGGARTVVSNLDDYLIGPLGKAYFNFNMQFDFDASIIGDLEVTARGAESLMANELRSQRLMQFLGVVAPNPMLAPFVKLDVVVREIAKTLDLDPDKVVNSLPDAAVQAVVMQRFSAAAPEGGGETPAGLDVSSGPGSGGGTMGTGNAPGPGMQGFSANTGQGAVQ